MKGGSRRAPSAAEEDAWPSSKESDVYYERRGRRDRNAPALLFLHGLGSSADDWTLQLPAVADDYRVILVDLPGHGRSALPPGRLTVSRMAGDVDTLLGHLGEAPVHVVGLSLGACVALALAQRAPDRVRSLTLVNAFARLRPADAHGALRLALRAVLLGTAPMMTVAALVARAVFPRPEQEALRAAAAASLARTSRRSYVAAAAAVTAFDARASLADVRCPTMVVAGLEDGTVDIDAKHALARGIVGARLILVPESGHATNIDQPAAFNAVLKEFLATR